MTKEIVAAVIKEMPQEFHMDELFQRLVFIEEIEAARKEINNGNGIPRKEVIEKIEEAEKMLPRVGLFLILTCKSFLKNGRNNMVSQSIQR